MTAHDLPEAKIEIVDPGGAYPAAAAKPSRNDLQEAYDALSEAILELYRLGFDGTGNEATVALATLWAEATAPKLAAEGRKPNPEPAGVGEARPAEPPQTKTVEMPIAMRGPAVYWRTKDSVGAPAEEQPDAREALSVFVETCRDLGRGALRTALETSDTPADDALDVFDRTLDHIAGYASGASAPLAALTKERDGLREQLDAGERDNTRLLNECVEAEDRVSVLTGALEEALSYRRTGRMPHDVLERLRAALGDVAAGESLEANSAKNAEVRATADKEA